MTPPTFITLGPAGTCHENALLHYLDFQGLAEIALVEDLLLRTDVSDHRSLGIVSANCGYLDLTQWEIVVDQPSKPVVARNLLAGEFDAGLTNVHHAEEHPDKLQLVGITAPSTRRERSTEHTSASTAT